MKFKGLYMWAARIAVLYMSLAILGLLLWANPIWLGPLCAGGAIGALAIYALWPWGEHTYPIWRIGHRGDMTEPYDDDEAAAHYADPANRAIEGKQAYRRG